ncbi:helix-turn-helix domain-containing protein, partial [Arthrospira platensis SPKY2]
KYVNLDGKLEWADEIMNPETYSTQKILSSISTGENENDHSERAGEQSDEQLISLEEMEKRAIANAIKVLNHNMTRVAGALGISRNALYQKIKKYNLE